MTWNLGTTNQEHLDEHNLFDHAGIATPTAGRILGVSGGKYTQILGFVRIDDGDSPYTVADDDGIILADCSSTTVVVNLPAVSGANGRSLLIKRIGASNGVTINRAGADQIITDGAGVTSKSLGSEGAHWSGVASSGDSGWITVGEYGTVT